jgi:hypothetical protein
MRRQGDSTGTHEVTKSMPSVRPGIATAAEGVLSEPVLKPGYHRVARISPVRYLSLTRRAM